MPFMKQVDIEEYKEFCKFYLKKTNKRVMPYKSKVGSRFVRDKDRNETICSESHRMGKSKYLIHPSWHEEFIESRENKNE